MLTVPALGFDTQAPGGVKTSKNLKTKVPKTYEMYQLEDYLGHHSNLPFIAIIGGPLFSRCHGFTL